jgi:hypothetical protein
MYVSYFVVHGFTYQNTAIFVVTTGRTAQYFVRCTLLCLRYFVKGGRKVRDLKGPSKVEAFTQHITLLVQEASRARKEAIFWIDWAHKLRRRFYFRLQQSYGM